MGREEESELEGSGGLILAVLYLSKFTGLKSQRQ
jgi:hypothetical protein